MKKSLVALAALSGLAGAASAQSSVTLFGILDVGVRNTDNKGAGDRTTMSTSGLATSRLGFRGIEDLGGGLRAGFWLEGQINPDTGGAGGSNGTPTSAFFNRRSTVSLMGNFGEVRLGRDYVPTYWNTTLFDPYGTVGVGGSSNIYSDSGYGTLTAAGKTPAMGTGAITALRDNNAVQYFLPAGLGGVYGQAMVAAGEGGTGGKYYGARIGWASGPIDVAFAWGRNPKTGAMLDDMTLWNVGGSYDFGVAKVMAIYNDWEGAIAGFDGIGPNLGWTQKNWLIGAYVPFGPGRFSASYSQTKRELLDGSKPKVDQIAVGYVYELSKRTALYGTYSHVGNDDGLAFTAGADGPAFTETGRTSSGAEIGIRHSF